MKVKIVAEMTQAEKDELISDYGDSWTIEQIVFDMVGPYDSYQDVEVKIVEEENI